MKGANPRAECDRVSASWGRDRTPLTTRKLACTTVCWTSRGRQTHVYIGHPSLKQLHVMRQDTMEAHQM